MPAYFSHSDQPKPPKTVFLAAFIVVFFCSLSAADSIGFVPDYIDSSTPLTTGGTAPDVSPATSETASVQSDVALSSLPQLGPSTNSEQATTSPVVSGVEPERIKISSIDLDLPVQNPDTRDVKILDADLLKGPARYVDSAKLGEAGNTLIFAHSSNYPVVRNQMYKAFNRISELHAGETIVLEGAGKEYFYSVTGVRKADVKDATIDLSPSQGRRLTLVTCDNFTGKSARFIVEADFVGTYAQ